MSVTLTLRPVDAHRRLLPVRYKASLSRDNQTVASADCAPGTSVKFPGLAVHRIYFAETRPDSHATSAQFLVMHDDHREEFLCLLSAGRVDPDLPGYSELDEDVAAVLDRSPRLDLDRVTERPEATRDTGGHDLGARTAAPDRVVAPRHLDHTRDGAARYERLTNEERAGLLNLFAKMQSVTLGDGRTVWASVDEIEDVARDRLHLVVTPELFTRVDAGACFKEADGSLHEPPPGHVLVKSFKTQEPYGNLQLTFFALTTDRVPYLVDADVDDAAGIEHYDQVIRNETQKFIRKILGGVFRNLPEGTTHPFSIHQILLYHQGRAGGPCASTIGPYEARYTLVLRDGSIVHSV